MVTSGNGVVVNSLSCSSLSDAMPLWARLSLSRRVAGLTQTEMGKLVGASRPTVHLWENGVREPSFSQVVRWANESSQPLEWLAEGVECARRDSNPQPSDP